MGNPVAWFEIVGQDGARLRQFYGELFGWPIDASQTGMDYGLVAQQPNGIAGGIGRSEDGGPGHVTVYVEVDDIQEYLQKAERLGGKMIAPPMDIPGWNLSIGFMSDPEGHLVGLSKGVVSTTAA
jgi:predicted enzyme related to lactoylglutathione lyase